MQAPYNCTADNELKGLGGWLVLVGVGVVVGPISLLYQSIPAYLPLFREGALTTLREVAPQLHAVVLAEIIVQMAYFVALVWAVWLFFSQHWLFPRIYIFLLMFAIVFIVVDGLALSYLMPNVPFWDEEIKTSLIRGIIGCAIWIPYMLKSRRVRLTFVEKR